jgi:NTE family protein
VDVVVTQSELRGMAGADIVLPVHLNGFTLADYKKSEAMIQKGVEAATEKSRLLEKFALNDAEWREFQQERDARRLTTVPAPQFVRVTGAQGEATARIEQFLASFVGKPLDTRKLESALTQLSGVGRFDRVGYRLTQKDGRDGLLVTVEEKTDAPPTIQPAFQVDGSDNTNVEFTLGTRLTFLDVAGFRSEWRTDLLFGSTYGIQSELYRPWSGSSRWFFAPHAEASNRAFHVFRGNTPLADYRLNRVVIGADIGYAFNRFTELRVGYETGYLNAKLRLGTPQFSSVSGRVAGPRLHFLMDRTDDPVIPRRGVQIESNFHWYDTHADAREAFPAMDLRAGYFQPITRPASVFVYVEGGSTFGRLNTGLPQFFLGGPQRLSAYGLNELYGDQYFYGRAGYLHDLFTLPPFVGKKIYAVGALEMAKMYGAVNSSRLPTDFAAGVIAETSLGPLFLGGSVGDTGHHKWFFQLGRVF